MLTADLSLRNFQCVSWKFADVHSTPSSAAAAAFRGAGEVLQRQAAAVGKARKSRAVGVAAAADLLLSVSHVPRRRQPDALRSLRPRRTDRRTEKSRHFRTTGRQCQNRVGILADSRPSCM